MPPPAPVIFLFVHFYFSLFFFFCLFACSNEPSLVAQRGAKKTRQGVVWVSVDRVDRAGQSRTRHGLGRPLDWGPLVQVDFSLSASIFLVHSLLLLFPDNTRLRTSFSPPSRRRGRIIICSITETQFVGNHFFCWSNSSGFVTPAVE
jgi:hypothetical protein